MRDKRFGTRKLLLENPFSFIRRKIRGRNVVGKRRAHDHTIVCALEICSKATDTHFCFDVVEVDRARSTRIDVSLARLYFVCNPYITAIKLVEIRKPCGLAR